MNLYNLPDDVVVGMLVTFLSVDINSVIKGVVDGMVVVVSVEIHKVHEVADYGI